MAEIALVWSAVAYALCCVVRRDAGRPASYAAGNQNRRQYLECMCCRCYLGPREIMTRARFNVECNCRGSLEPLWAQRALEIQGLMHGGG
jgi:hypothetical protein